METHVIRGLTDFLLTSENLIIMVAVGVMMAGLRRILPELFRNRFVARGLPLYPILLCMGAIWIPGLRPPMTTGATLMMAVVLGGMVGHIYKIVFQTVLGKGVAPKSSIPAPNDDCPGEHDGPD